MEAELQGLERPAGEHKLTVQHEAILCDIAKTARDLGEIPLKRLLVPGLQVNPLAATVGDAAKAIVLRLVLPSFTEGQFVEPVSLRRKTKKLPSNRERLQSFTDLSPGDLVVHEHHGIGRYVGIFRMPVDGVEKDYVKIAYAGTDSL
jgi:transcription-repair coupling factor (superfamily II helicase)